CTVWRRAEQLFGRLGIFWTFSCKIALLTLANFRPAAENSTPAACAPRIRIGHASFLRKRRAHKLKRIFDITISTKRFGQYSKKFAPRRIIARMSAMKYVVGNSAPSA